MRDVERPAPPDVVPDRIRFKGECWRDGRRWRAKVDIERLPGPLSFSGYGVGSGSGVATRRAFDDAVDAVMGRRPAG